MIRLPAQMRGVPMDLMELAAFVRANGIDKPKPGGAKKPAEDMESRVSRSVPMSDMMGGAMPHMQMQGAARDMPMPTPAPAPTPQIASPQSGAGAPLAMSMLAPIPDARRLTQPLPSLPPVGSPERPIRLEDVLRMPEPDIMPIPEPQPWMPTGPRPGMEGFAGPGLRGDFMRADTLGRGPVVGGDNIQELLSSPEFEETGTFDFGGPEGSTRMFNRIPRVSDEERALQDRDLRDIAANDIIMGGREAGYLNPRDAQRGRERAARGQATLGELDKTRAAEMRGADAIELQNLRADLARELDAAKTGRANKQEQRLSKGLEFKMTEADWRRAYNVAKFDQTERDSLGKLLSDQRQTLATQLAEVDDEATFKRLLSELTVVRNRQKELSETPLEAPGIGGDGAAPAAGGGEATEDEVRKVAESLPDTLSREEAIAEIEKRLGKKIPKSLRGE